jgi:hypothetical protein
MLWKLKRANKSLYIIQYHLAKLDKLRIYLYSLNPPTQNLPYKSHGTYNDSANYIERKRN